jgi:F1F0 ATPase subunit 2
MNTTITLILVFLAGNVLGMIFFGGLWLTLKWGLKSYFAGLWLTLSMLLRSTIVLCGMYWIGQAQWPRIAVCLLGFIVMRVVLTRWLPPMAKVMSHNAQEVKHAP